MMHSKRKRNDEAARSDESSDDNPAEPPPKKRFSQRRKNDRGNDTKPALDDRVENLQETASSFVNENQSDATSAIRNNDTTGTNNPIISGSLEQVLTSHDTSMRYPRRSMRSRSNSSTQLSQLGAPPIPPSNNNGSYLSGKRTEFEVAEENSIGSTVPTLNSNIMNLEKVLEQKFEDREEEDREDDQEMPIITSVLVNRAPVFGRFGLFISFVTFIIVYTLWLLDKQAQELEQLSVQLNTKIIQKNIERSELRSLIEITQKELDSTISQLKMSESNELFCQKNATNLESKFKTLRDDSTALAAELDKTQMKLDSALISEGDARIDLAEARSQITSLVAQKDELIQSNLSCTNSVTLLSDEKDTATGRIAELETTLENAYDDNKLLQASREQETALCKDFQSKLAQTEKTVKQLEDQIDSLVVQKDELTQSYSSCNNTVGELLTIRDAAKKLEKELEKVNGRGLSYRQQIKGLEEKINYLVVQKDELIQSYSSCNDSLNLLSNDRDSITSRIAELETTILTAYDDNKLLKASHEQETALREDFQYKLAQTEKTVEQLEDQIDSIVTQKDELIQSYSSCNNTVASLSKDRDITTSRILELEGTLANANNDNKLLQASHGEEVKGLEEKINYLVVQKDEIIQSYSSCNDSLNLLSSDKDSLTSRIAELETTILTAYDDNKLLKASHEQETALREDVQSKLLQTQDIVQQLEEKIGSLTSQKDELEKNIDSFVAQKDELIQSNSSCNDSISSMLNDKEQSSRRILELETSLEHAYEENKLLQDTKENIQFKLEETQKSMNQMKTKLSEEGSSGYYQTHIKQLEDMIETKDSSIEELKLVNDMLEKEKDSLKKALDTQMSEAIAAMNAVAATAASLKIDQLDGNKNLSQSEKDAILNEMQNAVKAVADAKRQGH